MPVALDRFAFDNKAPSASIPPAFRARCTSPAPGMVRFCTYRPIPSGILPQGPKYPDVPVNVQYGSKGVRYFRSILPGFGVREQVPYLDFVSTKRCGNGITDFFGIS